MDRQTDGLTFKWTDRQMDRGPNRQGRMDRQTRRQKDICTGVQMDRQVDRQTGGRKQTDKQINRWKDEQVDR